MKRTIFRRSFSLPGAVLAALILAALACSPDSLSLMPTATQPRAASTTQSPTPSPEAGLPALPSETPLVLPTPLPPALTPTPPFAWLPGDVRVFPGPDHYVGDVLTVEITVANSDALGDASGARLLLGNDEVIANTFLAYSPLRDNAIVFQWALETTNMQPGDYQMTVEIEETADRPKQAITFTITLLEAQFKPAYEVNAAWERLWSDCCRFLYLDTTAAGRDILNIAEVANQSVSTIEESLGVIIDEKPVPVTLIDNVWGNGAYVREELVMSYVDRGYTTIDLSMTFRHEAAHWAMREIGRPYDGGLLSEGAAVYFSGGHFKQEPIPARAAALKSLGLYIPLEDLADNFWTYQHETAYLEGAGFVAFLVETYGLDAFLELYASERENSAGSPAQWLSGALRDVYGMGLLRLERDYKDWLDGQDPGTQVDDLRVTIKLFETIRYYQSYYSPYQEYLPKAQDAEQFGHKSEYIREARSPINVGLETMLVEAGSALARGNYADAEVLINEVQAVMNTGDFSRKPAADYIAVAQTLAAFGYETQAIQFLSINRAAAEVIRIEDWPALSTVRLRLNNGVWQIIDS